MLGYNLLGDSLLVVLYNIGGTYYSSTIILSLIPIEEKARFLSLCGEEMTIQEIKERRKYWK